VSYKRGGIHQVFIQGWGAKGKKEKRLVTMKKRGAVGLNSLGMVPRREKMG